jgi:hypothetical protein
MAASDPTLATTHLRNRLENQFRMVLGVRFAWVGVPPAGGSDADIANRRLYAA